MEHSLHFWVQFVIMPIFALANAGVAFSLSSLGDATFTSPLGIIEVLRPDVYWKAQLLNINANQLNIRRLKLNR